MTSDQLASALQTVLPAAPVAPPSEDELVRSMAATLGVSEAQLRAAITKVEGTDRHYFFSVPLPRDASRRQSRHLSAFFQRYSRQYSCLPHRKLRFLKVEVYLRGRALC